MARLWIHFQWIFTLIHRNSDIISDKPRTINNQKDFILNEHWVNSLYDDFQVTGGCASFEVSWSASFSWTAIAGRSFDGRLEQRSFSIWLFQSVQRTRSAVEVSMEWQRRRNVSRGCAGHANSLIIISCQRLYKPMKITRKTVLKKALKPHSIDVLLYLIFKITLLCIFCSSFHLQSSWLLW